MPNLLKARAYTVAEVNKRSIPFSYWPVKRLKVRTVIQPVLFSSDPWEIMFQSIRSETPTTSQPEAVALIEQSRDYYTAARSSVVAAAKPVLLYYSYMNMVKSFLLHRSVRATYESAQHGLSAQLVPGGRELLDAFLLAFPSGGTINIFDDFLTNITGCGLTTTTTFHLVNILPQIVPGHRIWSVAADEPERFVAVDKVEFAQDTKAKELWSNLIIERGDLKRISCTVKRFLAESGLQANWKQRKLGRGSHLRTKILLQPGSFINYSLHPSQELIRVVPSVRPHLWSTILSVPPFRKYYLYLCPPAERNQCLSQLLSMYALMYYLGSITRYRPHDFDKIIETPFGGFIQSCLEDQPKQFLFMMASEFAKQEVTQSALI